MKLKSTEKKMLLDVARGSIEAKLRGEKPAIPSGGIFDEKLGVFVTLKDMGRLRGCCGFPYPTMPLGNALIEAAQSAAFRDPRFPALTLKQYDRVTLEVSLLTEPQKIMMHDRATLPEHIRIGTDGLIIRLGGRGGLLLPIVATEHGLDGRRFLETLCHKAGLPPNSWRENGSEIYTFQATVIKETDVQ